VKPLKALLRHGCRANAGQPVENAAHALAEPIDNSIRGRAANIELLCAERIQLEERRCGRIEQAAALDDGQEWMLVRSQNSSPVRQRKSPVSGLEQGNTGRFGPERLGLRKRAAWKCGRVNGAVPLFMYLDLDVKYCIG